jgi:hypothetical protein
MFNIDAPDDTVATGKGVYNIMKKKDSLGFGL